MATKKPLTVPPERYATSRNKNTNGQHDIRDYNGEIEC